MRIDQQFATHIDQQAYQERDLITLKVPLSLPYYSDTHDFERVDGEVTFNGIIYKYIKRKIEGGELVLICLPNDEKTNILTAKNDFFKSLNDLQDTNAPTKSSKNQGLTKNIMIKYDHPGFSWTLVKIVSPIVQNIPAPNCEILSGYSPCCEHPPDVI